MNGINLNPLLRNKVSSRLQRITNVLLLNASFIDNIGLLNGKMGIAIFFYRYGRYSNIKVYTDYAGELIDEIYEEINLNTSTDFTDGLTGIGWGIEYLIENKFVDADSDEALSEIDNAVYRNMLNNPLLIDNGNDLFDYGLYCISRLKGHQNDADNSTTLIKKEHLKYLIDECSRLLVDGKYMESDIQQMSVSFLNSLLWFLLEMDRLALFPATVKKILEYLPDYRSCGPSKLNSRADISIFHNLCQKASEQFTEESLREQYLALAVRTGKELNNQPNNDKSALSFLQSVNLQKLIYSPYINGTVDDRELFTKAFEIIDDEVEWTKILDGLSKSNLGLTGLAGAGLLLMDAHNLNDLHDLHNLHDWQDNFVSKSSTHWPMLASPYISVNELINRNKFL